MPGLPRWPWSRGNRHKWHDLVYPVNADVRCVHCNRFSTYENMTAFGCTALPVPAASAPERSALPVPSCAHNTVWAESPRTVDELRRQMALGTEYECARCGETWRGETR